MGMGFFPPSTREAPERCQSAGTELESSRSGEKLGIQNPEDSDEDQ